MKQFKFFLIALFAIIFIFGSDTLFAQGRNMYWHPSATNNNLHNPSNWTDEHGIPISGQYPTKDDNVFFTDNSAHHYLTIESGDIFECRNITCTSNALYNIASKVTVKIYGNIDVNENLTCAGRVEMVNDVGETQTEFTISMGFPVGNQTYFGGNGFYIQKPGKTVKLLSDIFLGSSILAMDVSVFNANGYTLSVFHFYTDEATAPRTINFANSKLITVGGGSSGFSCLFGANTTYQFSNSEFATAGMQFDGMDVKFNILRAIPNSNNEVLLYRSANTNRIEIDSLIIKNNVIFANWDKKLYF